MGKKICWIKAGSILGTEPTGYEKAPEFLIDAGLNRLITTDTPVIDIPDLNGRYIRERDETGMLNSKALRDYSITLKKYIAAIVKEKQFPIVLGGDCSLLLGITPALKEIGRYGLVTLDGHADYYFPNQSPTGEAADMDIALVTGKGPDIIANIENMRPYVLEEDVIHIGLRDDRETIRYGSAEIRDTAINCFPSDMLENNFEQTKIEILNKLKSGPITGFWLHFDVDVIHDDENSAVYARLPGGLRFAKCERLMHEILDTGKIVGLSVCIYNPNYDKNGTVGQKLVNLLLNLFS